MTGVFLATLGAIPQARCRRGVYRPMSGGRGSLGPAGNTGLVGRDERRVKEAIPGAYAVRSMLRPGTARPPFATWRCAEDPKVAVEAFEQ